MHAHPWNLEKNESYTIVLKGISRAANVRRSNSIKEIINSNNANNGCENESAAKRILDMANNKCNENFLIMLLI